MNELTRRLTKELGVTKKQAEGGLVAILRAGKENMAPRDYAQFVADIPGAAELMKKAPPPSMMSSLAGGVGALFGRSSPGRWAGLAASFSELGVDLTTAKKFGPIVIDYVAQHGGEDRVDKIKAALKV
jgi:hypothetical protein